MSASRFDNEGGFSLIEVMLALTIFAIGLLAVATLQITSVHGNSLANQMTIASNLAQGRITTFENVAVTSLTNVNAQPDGSYNADGTNFAGTGGYFTRTYTLQSGPGVSKWLTVTVNWSNPVNHNVTYTVLLR